MRAAIGAIALSALAAPGALAAQATTAEQALAQAHAVYSAESVSNRCRPASGDEIVVCADKGRDQRMPSTAESDPNSREARRFRDGGHPSAPRVTDLPDCSVEHCIRVGSAPPPLYLIDLHAIPLPPEGSDADLIAKGEKRAP